MYRNILRCSTLVSHIFFVILMEDDDWSLGIILGLPTELKSGLLSKWLERHVCCSRTRLRPPRARERLSRTQGFLCAGRAKVDKNLLGIIPRELGWFARRQKCDIKEHFAPARRGVFSKMTDVWVASRKDWRERSDGNGNKRNNPFVRSLRSRCLSSTRAVFPSRAQQPDETQAIKWPRGEKRIRTAWDVQRGTSFFSSSFGFKAEGPSAAMK